MSTTSNASLITRARATHGVKERDVSKVLCHRLRAGVEEYLIKWRIRTTSEHAMASWHAVDQLTDCLKQIQLYIEESNEKNLALKSSLLISNDHHASRKRKSPGGDPVTIQSRDAANGLLTPHDPRQLSRASSVGSISSSGSKKQIVNSPSVYNGFLVRKAGRIKGQQSSDPIYPQINADTLPTPEMVNAAKNCPMTEAERLIRELFYLTLNAVPNVHLENKVDGSTPSLNFTFTNKLVYQNGIYQAPVDTYEGCGPKCKPNMGQNCGCEYTKVCQCLEFAAVDEQQLKKMPEWDDYVKFKEEGGSFDTSGAPKRFPYLRGHSGRPSILQSHYLESREPIYECNPNCNCGPMCKTRLVQKGRKVGLTIFKTRDRGWGLYCNEDLIEGEFIDTYLGEVITNEEADLREAQSKDKSSYLYALDKFVGDEDVGGLITQDDCYVVDGQHMGGPTRFINHSCEPNCRQYSVCYNKHDLRLYHLAFFAYEDIPQGTELTFDYADKDEEEEAEAIRRRQAAALDPENKDRLPCNCGATKCRGFLWD
ncbi:SET domain-containing protein [Acrodontium crateriforme]|uniref:SET domain-containing protein n=1 Tax=Acrodontium crateriforme TaxID=150365 RepID=A0AAQ3M430_9PEZI|nr:SET domain-containing protein [Acrodontium crateriforme]